MKEHYSITRFLQTALFVALGSLCACQSPAPKSDAELGLTPQQAAGRRVFQGRCAECHDAYSSRDLHGPSLKGVFKKPYLPSGTPANDDRMREVITLGRAMMPGFGRELTPDEITELIAYLHTL